MASTSAIPPGFSLLIENNQRRRRSSSSVEFNYYYYSQQRTRIKKSSSRNRNRNRFCVLAMAGVAAAEEGDLNQTKNEEKGPSESQSKAQPGMDTRIHWGNEEEGWLGGGGGVGSSTKGSSKKQQVEEEKEIKIPDLLNSSTDSHYQFLGISAEADLEEIKSAYRRLSKEYHPDTTLLPLKAASEKFMKLRQVYDVLSDEETRKFYDWTLAQEVAAQEAEKMKIKLEDPYDQEVRNWVPVPDMVDQLGGRNMKLSDQASAALTIDIIVIIFSICCLIYVSFFKQTPD